MPDEAWEAGSGLYLQSIDEAAVLEEAAQGLLEKQQRDAERQGGVSATNGALNGPSTSAQQQSAALQASGPRPQRVGSLRVGTEVDLICQSLAFGGQVCSHPHLLGP